MKNKKIILPLVSLLLMALGVAFVFNSPTTTEEEPFEEGIFEEEVVTEEADS